ncbi:MAG: Tfp pilus assembly protein FimT/FimU [Synechocystis sp.]
MSYPNMAGMRARSQLKDTQTQVKSALMDAQRTAIKKGQTCTLTFTKTNSGTANEKMVITSTPADCITSGGGGDDSVVSDTDDTPQKVSSKIELRKKISGRNVITNISGGTIEFSYKGTTTLSDSGTIILQSTGTPNVKCLVISSPLGIIRSGNYEGSLSPINSNNCNTSL